MNKDLLVKRIGNTFVGEVEGIDLAIDHDAASIILIREALLEHKVLVFRNQKLSNEDHVNFSKKFGLSEFHNVTHYLLPNFPEILVLSNRGNDGTKPVANGGAYWHSDMSYKAIPPMGSILYALEVPPEGGDTMFSDMEAAYENLPHTCKSEIKGLEAVHSYLPRFFKQRAEDEKFKNQQFELSDEQKSKFPEVVHPVVSFHPEAKYKVLFVNEGFTTRIKGLKKEKSDILLEKLYQHATKDCFIYVHKWSAGDVVFWDNRSTMHKATSYNLKYPRRMHRTTIR